LALAAAAGLVAFGSGAAAGFEAAGSGVAVGSGEGEAEEGVALSDTGTELVGDGSCEL
jgi:hypothetical protein